MAAVPSQWEVQVETSTGSSALPSNSETTAVSHHTKTNSFASENGDINRSIAFANETPEKHQTSVLAREDGEDGVCQNGPVLQCQEPAFNLDPTSSPQKQEPSPGSNEPPLALENEEQIRLQARRRLDEQLKQYRVKRQQERTTPKHRPSSTLDPELMLNPETLPRASTVAMTKEYSFFRTSVQRGPKLGSLGLPAPSKERKSTRTSKSSKIRSLADYRTDESGLGNASGRSPGDDMSSGLLKPNRGSSTSVVSEISLSSNVDDRLETSSQITDNISEADGSEAGLRMDGNESDSSTYSSVSGVSNSNPLPFLEGKQAVPYIVDGQEIRPEEVGQFPSIKEVLQAAAAEYQSQTPDENGEVRSRRDSISSSVSIGSSLMGTHDEVLQVLKEKIRLEGQLESLSLEANQALKEKTELQAQLAAVNAQLQAQVEQNELSQQKQSSLNSEVSTLKQTCTDLERSVVDLQSSLEAKNASLISLNTDLQMAEEQYQRLIGKVEELQQSIVGKDNTVLDLRQQMAALQSQLQQVQLEKTTMFNSLKASQTEITSLQQARQWYQQQLMLAQEARIRLQSEMANMQAGNVTQVGTLEHLKLENVALSQQLTETQHRSIKEKERIAAQLQSIEADMMDQDAAFHQIQEAKTMVEEDLQRKLEEFEEQRDQLQKLADSAVVLERELEQVKVILHQRELQFEALQQEQLDLIKQLTMSQEAQYTQEQSLNELQARYEELEAQIAEYQREAESKEDVVQNLRKEKIFLEVALQAAKEEKEALDEGTQRLEEGTGVASEVLEQLRQEIAVKSNQVESIQQENTGLRKQTQKLKEQFMQQKVMVEAYRRDASSKDQLISELKATKKRLDSELRALKQELLSVHGEKKSMEMEQARLQKEVSHVRQQLTDMDAQLQTIQDERNELEMELQSLQFDKEQLKSLTEENEEFKKQISKLQLEAKTDITEQKQKMKKLGSDLTSAQKEMKSKHKAYENAVGILSRRLQEALTAKETAEAEVSRLKAQVTDGGDSQATLERLRTLESELKVVSHSKAMLEKELQEIISLTSQELEEYREKVLELEDELQEARGFRKKIKRLEDLNKKLTLDLEHERGKLTGLGQSHSALREHAKILETALANREADLVQLNLQVQAVLKRKEEEDHQMKQVVQTLQAALEKEKAKVRDLRQQVAAAKAEAAHSRRHYRAAAMELSEVKKELQAKEQLVNALQAEADKLQSQDESHSQEIARFQQELAEARTQLQVLKKQLDDELKKEPAVNQELEDLKWEVEQKEMEIQALKQHVDLTEQRTQKEIESVQSALQRIKAELEVVREELSGTQKDKFILQAKVTELKNSMKTLLIQNQQLKLELRHMKTRKKKDFKGDANTSNPVTPVKIPDCPVPASLLEELLKPATALSKEPLNNLHNCLRQLRDEMDTLQRQMEEHTVTVHESMSSWSQMEGQLMELTAVCPTEDPDHTQSEATQPIVVVQDFETLNQ
ncbi:golgin subfamily A member 3 isoform X2 [Protopterus annectens]|uniref:golgin subfamily A member 3 isoform X2 n=1 Tax=Protopterus annectens TaxID=7888 RepID=UPI001CFA62B5|nr:golgin subfamily A member 3 isoform X2 [Protopterus annectens]